MQQFSTVEEEEKNSNDKQIIPTKLGKEKKWLLII